MPVTPFDITIEIASRTYRGVRDDRAKSQTITVFDDAGEDHNLVERRLHASKLDWVGKKPRRELARALVSDVLGVTDTALLCNLHHAYSLMPDELFEDDHFAFELTALDIWEFLLEHCAERFLLGLALDQAEADLLKVICQGQDIEAAKTRYERVLAALEQDPEWASPSVRFAAKMTVRDIETIAA